MANSFTLYEHHDLAGETLTFHLDDYPAGALHSLKGTTLHDEVSSLAWDLDEDVVVVLYEHDDATGRAYQFGPGPGVDRSTHDEDFKDCATSWRWTRLGAGHTIPEAFGWIAADGRGTKFDRGDATLDGGHLQGVGWIDARTLAISASSDDGALVFLVQWGAFVGTGLGRIIDQIPVAAPPLDHAGGLQVTDGVLVVGAEDDGAKDRSRVEFYDVRDPAAVRHLPHLGFDRPGPGQPPATKRWTAGAAGMAKLGDRFLVVVGSWGSDELDFYTSTGPTLADPSCRFIHHSQWRSDRADKSGWIDDNWADYQSLNLFVDPPGRLYLLGGNRNAGGHDWIDLYAVNLDAAEERRLVKIGKRHLICHEGASFRWAGGFVQGGNVLHAVAAERDLHTATTINLFEGPGRVTGGFRFLANRRSRETHSLLNPCAWMSKIAARHRLLCSVKPEGYRWCDYCFPALADG